MGPLPPQQPKRPMRFNPPPGWPKPGDPRWMPPPGWRGDPSWQPAPVGWQWYVPEQQSWFGRHKVLTAVAAIVALFALLAWAGSVQPTSTQPTASEGSATPAAAPAVVPSRSPAADPSPSPAATHTLAPRSPTHRPTHKPTPAAPNGHVIVVAGLPTPDHHLTPGEAFAGVTAAQVCVTGWSEAHRDVPDSEKVAVFAEYGISYSAHGSYEVDHLIPLEIGGDNSMANLWPEKGSIPNRKDALENRLRTLVCDGQLSLSTAQYAIASNWPAALQQYFTSAPAPAQPQTTAPAPQPVAPAPAPGHPAGATALCNDGTFSYSAHHQGSCSSHHSVRTFFD